MINGLLERCWPTLALRGVIAVLFGVLALISPIFGLIALVALFAAFALFGGVASLIGAYRARKADDEWSVLLLLGAVGLGVGIVTLVHPALTALVLVLVIGANALVTGILDIVLAVRLRKLIRNEWLLILSGVVSIAFGVLVFLFPDAGALALAWLIGFYALVSGSMLLALAFRLRAHSRIGQPERRIIHDRRASTAGT